MKLFLRHKIIIEIGILIIVETEKIKETNTNVVSFLCQLVIKLNFFMVIIFGTKRINE